MTAPVCEMDGVDVGESEPEGSAVIEGLIPALSVCDVVAVAVADFDTVDSLGDTLMVIVAGGVIVDEGDGDSEMEDIVGDGVTLAD